MITYGLVKNVGPYGKGYLASYHSSNTERIAPSYPYEPSLGLPTPSKYAKREVMDGEGVANPRFPNIFEQRQKWERQNMFKKVVEDLVMHNRFSRRTEIGDQGDFSTPGGQPDDPNTLGENTQEPPLNPGVYENMYPDVDVEEEIIELNEATRRPAFEGQTEDAVSTMIRTSGNVASLTNRVGNYVQNLVPVLSALVDLREITIDSIPRILFGPNLNPGPMYNALRRGITQQVQNYIANPATDAIRGMVFRLLTEGGAEAVSQAINALQRQATDNAWGVAQEGANQLAPVVTQFFYPYLQQLSNLPNTLDVPAAPLLLEASGGTQEQPSLIRLVTDYLLATYNTGTQQAQAGIQAAGPIVARGVQAVVPLVEQARDRVARRPRSTRNRNPRYT
jgi:hypothetical protein